MAKGVTPKKLPKWADEWIDGECGCGARLCRVDCFCAGHTVCSASGWSPEKCRMTGRYGSSA